MKKTLFVSIILVVLCGCSVQQQVQVKSALGDALIVGREVQKMEQEKCQTGDTDSCKVADKIQVWVDAGQKIYDTDSFESNCDLMLSVTDIAYNWLIENYPDKPYRVFVALLRTKLEVYCEGGE